MIMRWIQILLLTILIPACGEVTANPFARGADGGVDDGGGGSTDSGVGGATGTGGTPGTGGVGGGDDDDDDDDDDGLGDSD